MNNKHSRDNQRAPRYALPFAYNTEYHASILRRYNCAITASLETALAIGQVAGTTLCLGASFWMLAFHDEPRAAAAHGSLAALAATIAIPALTSFACWMKSRSLRQRRDRYLLAYESLIEPTTHQEYFSS